MEYVLMFLFFGIPVLGLTSIFIMRITDPHRWSNRNPFDRTCSICGRHEVKHCYVDNWNNDWWEVFSDGDLSKHAGASK